jgi:hypothetical protein
MKIRAVLLLSAFTILSCRPDAPPPPATAGDAGSALDCPGLAEHWRVVWATETPQGKERRRAYVMTRVLAMWGEACSSVAKEPAQDLAPALEELRAARTFAGIEDIARSGGTTTKRLLAASAQSAVTRTRSAYDAAPTGGDECEEAISGAAFCGDDVDKAAVKSAAAGKEDGACAALSVLLTKKCVP